MIKPKVANPVPGVKDSYVKSKQYFFIRQGLVRNSGKFEARRCA